MRFVVGCLVLGLLLGMSTPAHAGDPDPKFVKWYQRLEKEVTDLEQRLAALGATSSDSAGAKRIEKGLTKVLMQLTRRVMELEKRLQALEEGSAGSAAKDEPTPQTDGPVADTPQLAAKGAAGAAAAKAKAKAALAFLKDPLVVEQLPAPPKDSKVSFKRTKNGIKKAGIGMPKGAASGPYGKLPCRPSAEVFLMEGAPIISFELILINKVCFRFENEKYVYLRISGNTTKSAVHWHGDIVKDGDETLYVETLHFGTGLPDLLAMLRSGRVHVLIGACEFVFDRVYFAPLRDLCSVLHPDRVDALL